MIHIRVNHDKLIKEKAYRTYFDLNCVGRVVGRSSSGLTSWSVFFLLIETSRTTTVVATNEYYVRKVP